LCREVSVLNLPPASETEEGLHRGIIEHPHDLDRRLVYADFLEEDGYTDRAELIRVGCELSKYPPWRCQRDAPLVIYQIDRRSYASCGFCTPCQLRDRELALLRGRDRSNEAFWMADVLREVCLTDGKHNNQRRFTWWWWAGFVDEVVLSCEDWSRHGPSLVQITPLRKVLLVDKKPERFSDGQWGWHEAWPLDLPQLPLIPDHFFRDKDDILVDPRIELQWATERAAKECLSDILVDWARREAQLPTDCPFCHGKGEALWFGEMENCWICTRGEPA
jgi:uncharacterized protein (TIGR02996 family)